MIDVTDRKALRDWFEQQDRDVMRIIAARCALRAFPCMNGLRLSNDKTDLQPGPMILSVIHAMSIPVSAVAGPNSIDKTTVNRAYENARYEAAEASATSSDAAYTSYAASHAAYTVIPNASGAIANAATSTAITAIAAFSNIADALKADIGISAYGTSARTFSLIPLWPQQKHDTKNQLITSNFNMPKELYDDWQNLKSYLFNLGEAWDVWTNWYEDRLRGGVPLVQALEIGDPENGDYGRATFPEAWYKDPAKLNAALKEKTRNHANPVSKTDSRKEAEVSPPFPSVYETQGGTAIHELKALKDVLENFIPQEKYIAGETNKTPIPIDENSFLTLNATVNALIEFQTVPIWEHNIRSTIQSLIRILKDLEKLLEQLGSTLGTMGKILKKPLRLSIEKLQKILEAAKPSDSE